MGHQRPSGSSHERLLSLYIQESTTLWQSLDSAHSRVGKTGVESWMCGPKQSEQLSAYRFHPQYNPQIPWSGSGWRSDSLVVQVPHIISP